MMPATLTASHIAPVLPMAASVSVSDLSRSERAVALYASDMPSDYRFRRGDRAVVESWIVQGATRLGLESLYRMTALHRGYRQARVGKYLSVEQKRAEAERFPKKARFNRADQMASNSILDFPPSAEALARSNRVEFDGECPMCQGAGRIWRLWVIDLEAEWYEEGYRPCWVCREAPVQASGEFIGVAA